MSLAGERALVKVKERWAVKMEVHSKGSAGGGGSIREGCLEGRGGAVRA